MCPACIASTAVMVAGVGSTGGILAVCIGKFRNFFRANRLGLFQKTVRVGIMVTHNPLYGSGQAGLPHPALTSGDNAHAAQGIRMTSTGGRQPAVDQAPHPVPKHAGFLAAPQERAMPEPTYLEPKRVQRRAVGRHSVITDVSTHNRAQPSANFRDGVMHAPFELDLDLAQLRLQPFAYRLSQHREPSIAPLLPADVRVSSP